MSGAPKPLPKAGGARPSSLPDQVPSAGDDADLLAALESYEAPTIAASSAPGERDLIAALNAQGGVGTAGNIAAQNAGIQDEGQTVMERAGRVADYPGGLVRTTAAAGIGAITGQPIGTADDFEKALEGKAPTSADYMRRSGVEEGFTINLPGGKRISQLDISGLALDIASDPATALAKLAREVPLMTKFLRKKSPILDTIAAVIANPGGTVVNQVGEDMYRSSFQKLGEKIGKEKANEVANQLIKKGSPLAGQAVQETAERISIDMGNIRQGFYDYADQLGVQIDLAKPGTFGRSEALLNKWMTSADPATEVLVGDLHDLLDSYKARGTANMADVSSFKTQLYHGLPKSAFQNDKIIGIADQFKTALADDLRRSIIRAGEQGERGLGKSIDKVNEVWGPIIEAKGPLAKQAIIEGRSSALGAQIDALAVASGNIAPAIARKTMEIAQTPYGRRTIGKALMQAGQRGYIDAITRRALSAQKPVPPSPVPYIDEED